MSAKYLQAFERRGDRSCTGVDCACRILTGNVPFGLPISRTLVISLPKVCKSLSVQLMCRGMCSTWSNFFSGNQLNSD